MFLWTHPRRHFCAQPLRSTGRHSKDLISHRSRIERNLISRMKRMKKFNKLGLIYRRFKIHKDRYCWTLFHESTHSTQFEKSLILFAKSVNKLCSKLVQIWNPNEFSVCLVSTVHTEHPVQCESRKCKRIPEPLSNRRGRKGLCPMR